MGADVMDYLIYGERRQMEKLLEKAAERIKEGTGCPENIIGIFTEGQQCEWQ